MKIEQFYLQCLAHASYLIIDERTKRAAVVDPQRDIEQYLEAAEAAGAKIESVLLTHFHADFIAGHLELRDRLGARIYLGARADAEYDFERLADGDVLEFGDVKLSILETPGHTPEGITIVAYDLGEDPETPVAAFTGDTLFVGDVGRPDLLASVGVTADELAGWLYDSLHGKLMKLPDETLVYPAHGAGSLCGKNLGKETFSTIGEQRRGNYALQPMSKDEFKALVTAEQPMQPQYFIHDAVLNKKERPTLDASLAESLDGLSLPRVQQLQAEGAVVIDVRDAAAFAAGHLPGSLNVGLDGSFATWAGTLVKPDARIIVVAEPGREREAAMRLGRIGLDGVEGFLEGGAASIDGAQPLATVEPAALAEELEGSDGPFVLDVRNAPERDGGHIDRSVNVPLGQLQSRLDEVPGDRDVTVVCRSGYRSSAAASILQAAGHTRLRNVTGGMDAWTAAALPMNVAAGAAGGSCSA